MNNNLSRAQSLLVAENSLGFIASTFKDIYIYLINDDVGIVGSSIPVKYDENDEDKKNDIKWIW